jgi:hypothetical protein
MPSDPAGRKPLGVLSRLAPDWFDDHLGQGYDLVGSLAVNVFHFTVFELFNNASDGSALKVYGVTAGADNSNGMQCFSAKGPFGTLIGACTAVRFDLPAPWGQIFRNDTIVASGSSADPYSLGRPIAGLGTGGFNVATEFADFPLFIIPPGFSLLVKNFQAGTALSCGFWYQVAHE